MAGETTFVASTVARVTVRPATIAHIVHGSDRAGFLRAVAYACTEWGGAGQPIVPIRRGLRAVPIYEQQIEVLRPETVIDFAGLTNDQRRTLGARWRTDVIGGDFLEYHEPGAPVGITVDSASLRARTMFTSATRGSLAQQTALGMLRPDQLSVWQSTGMIVSEPDSWLDVLDAQVDKPSPASITRWDNEAFEAEAFYAPVVVYADDNFSLATATFFWNMRAAAAPNGHHVLWLPAAALAEAEIAARLRSLALGRQWQAQPDLVLNGSVGTDLGAIAESMGFVSMPPGTPAFRHEFGAPPRDLAAQPLTYRTQLHPAQFLFGTRKVGRQISVQVTVSRPQSMIDFESPFQFHRGGGLVHVDVEEEQFTWPRSPATARLLEPNAQWTEYGLTVRFPLSSRFRLNIGVPDGGAVVSALLNERQWSWQLSDKGRYARALADAIPEAGASGVVSRRELEIIDVLTSLTRPKAEQAIRRALGRQRGAQAAAAAATTVLPALVPRWRTAGEIASDLHIGRDEVLSTLNALLHGHLVRRAFRYRCPNCWLETEIPLDRGADHITCDGCRTNSALRGPADSEPVIVYGLSSLLDRVMDQDCLGHLLVERWLRAHRGVVWSVPGADLTGPQRLRREADVLAASRKELVVAEVKKRAAGFAGSVVGDAASLGSALGAGRMVLAALDRWDEASRESAVRRVSGFTGQLDLLDASDLLGGPDAP